MKILYFFFASVFLLIAANAVAQELTIDEMMNDGNDGADKLIIKTNPFTMLNGDFPVYGEMRLSPKISVEVGVGIQTKYYYPELSGQPQVRFQSSDGPEFEGGYSLRLIPRFYLRGQNMNGSYFAPFLRRRHYGLRDYAAKVNVTDLCLITGRQYNLIGKLYIDVYVGIGYRAVKILHGESLPPLNESRSLQLVYPIGMKIGYGF